LALKNKTPKQSLYVTLGIIIITTVTIIMSIHSTHIYKDTKDRIVKKMNIDSKLTVVSLQKNITDLMESYSINEYDKLVSNEMDSRENFAIIVEDYNMGKIVGKKRYISGKIRDYHGNIINYNPDSIKQNRELQECYYSYKHEIKNSSGDNIGTITVYITDYSMNEELNQIIKASIINVVTISLLLTFFLFIGIRFFILKPLSDIIRVIQNRDANGIPFELIPSHGSIEIFTLSDTMNSMINSIRNSNIALKNHHNKLLEQKNELHHQANYDSLTGLANRDLFNDRLEQAIEKSKRNSTKMALLFIDLDHFKEINDSHGHKIGDEVLKVVTERFNKTIRREDTLARLGGDEFTVLIENLHQGQDASLLANKILKVLKKPITIGNNEFYVLSSIGISIYPDDGSSPADLLKYADAAMYKAKDEGRNNFQYYCAEMTELAFERVAMEASLRVALKNNEFIVYYQPQVDGNSNRLIGMEALIRWQHPTIGLVLPTKFIPLAESTGLIVELDRFVMKTTMTQISKWYKDGLNPGILAMNLSVLQLQQKDFLTMFSKLIEETGCSPEWLELEVTESQIMKNPEEAIKILNKISDIGIELAVDDFGTGYSSLSYLKKLPINKLKIDRSFVKDLPDDEEDIAITKAVIALAKSLNLRTIAEGVETKEQKEFLVENGCENIQGYFYAKPMPASDMEVTLLNQQLGHQLPPSPQDSNSMS